MSLAHEAGILDRLSAPLEIDWDSRRIARGVFVIATVGILAVLGLTLLGTAPVAADEPECSTVTYGGNGTTDNPFVVDSLETLQCIGHEDTETTPADNYTQSGLIDAQETESWNDGDGFEPLPAGTNEPFTGTYEGATIQGLHIDRPDDLDVGLFGTSGGEIDQLHLMEASITGDSRVGGIAGAIDGTLANASVMDSDISGTEFVGGLLGSNFGDIELSRVTDSDISGSEVVGGVTGVNHGAIGNATVNNDVTTTMTAGSIAGGSTGTIQQSTAEGNVTGFADEIGGVVGVGADVEITSVSSRSAVAGEDKVGGLIGVVEGDDTVNVTDSYAQGDVEGEYMVGGLVGAIEMTETMTLERSYAAPTLAGTDWFGGIVGDLSSGTLETDGIYWDEQVTGVDDGIGNPDNETVDMEGLSTDEMTGDSPTPAGNDTMPEFDFETPWTAVIIESADYPVLEWEAHAIADLDIELNRTVLLVDEVIPFTPVLTYTDGEMEAVDSGVGYIPISEASVLFDELSIVGMQPGSETMEFVAGEAETSVNVTVYEDDDLEDFTLEAPPLEVGETSQLTATADFDGEASGTNVTDGTTFSTDDDGISVSADGTLTAIEGGSYEVAGEWEGHTDNVTVEVGDSILSQVGVVDDADEYGEDIVADLEEVLPTAHYPVEVVNSTHPTAESPHDVYVVNTLEDDPAGFIDATNDSTVGVIYLDQWGTSSDAIPVLSDTTGDPAETDQADSFDGQEAIEYRIEQSHPILEDWDVNERIPVVEPAYADRTWFNDTEADVIASIGQKSEPVDGDALAVDDERGLVLASSLGYTSWTEDEHTAAGLSVLGNAVEYLSPVNLSVGVIDESGTVGADIAAAIENDSDGTDIGSAEVVPADHPDRFNAHDIYVVQEIDDDNRTVLAEAIERPDVGSVLLENVDAGNAISQFSAETGEPGALEPVTTTDSHLEYEVDTAHPIFEDWAENDSIELAADGPTEVLGLEPMESFPLATIGPVEDDSPVGLTVQDDYVLASGLARTANLTNEEFTEDADTVLRNAITHLGQDLESTDLEIVGPESLNAGETAQYSIEVTNYGSIAIDRTVTMSAHDEHLEEVSVTVDPGETETVTVNVTATVAVSEAGSLTAQSAGVETTQAVTVTDDIEGLNVTVFEFFAPTEELYPGEDASLETEVVFENGYEEELEDDVDYWSSNTSVIAMDGSDSVEAIEPGEATVFAEWDGHLGATQLTVPKPNVTDITLETDEEYFVGESTAVPVEGSLQGTTTKNLSEEATVTSNDTDVMTVENGSLHAVGPGTVTLNATYEEDNETFEDTATVTVLEPEFLDLSATVAESEIGADETTTLAVTAFYEADIEQDVTTEALVSPFDESIVSVEDETVTGESVGETEIFIEYEGTQETVPIEVSGASLASLSVGLEPSTLAVDDQGAVSVTGTYENGTETDLTSAAAIESQNQSIATVTNGTVEAGAPGTVAVSAEHEGLSDEATLTVTDPDAAPTFSMSVDNDGEVHALGVPGEIDGTFADAFPEGLDGLQTVYAYDNGWEQVVDFENETVEPLDAYVLSTTGDGPDEIELAVSLETGTSPTTRSVGPGWEFIAASAFSDAETSFGGADGAVTAMDRYGMPSADDHPEVSPFPNYLFGSYEWGVEPPAVSPFNGYFVYFDSSDDVPVVLSDVESQADASFQLGLTED